ncbi:hypothetical protein BMR1_03g04197 [Babesia microti strain RI]|uniref:Uncharacterized protein n=1 Tax=Babesia microti (strain RI) TaxID=1133968 RepID=A0A1R4ACD9_BABMR|nr:hypothetical protein BMR1_03g04197 [Babesia microti strain RI]SJK86650.1 hypothetical protein BMR1_03g04197 [Babesia microti strain RI]|eukprot:XP_021338781.1 hypothetical protein BMR1_03g04197 [Babesia microti strain RI]
MDDLDELVTIDLNILQMPDAESTQSCDNKLHLFNEDLAFIDQTIDNLDNEIIDQYHSDYTYNMAIAPLAEENNFYTCSRHNIGEGFKFASGKKVQANSEQLKKAKDFLGITDFALPRSCGEVISIAGSLDSVNAADEKPPHTSSFKFSLDHIISPNIATYARPNCCSISDSSNTECVATTYDLGLKSVPSENEAIGIIEDDTSLNTQVYKRASSDSTQSCNNINKDSITIEFDITHLKNRMINRPTKSTEVNTTNYPTTENITNNNSGFDGFSSARSCFIRGSSFGSCELSVPYHTQNKRCYTDNDSRFVTNWLKFTDCTIGKLTFDKLIDHWHDTSNPLTIRYNGIYDYKFITPNSQIKCYHIGGISDIRESFKTISNCNYTPDLTKWVTHHFKLLAYNECLKYRKKIYMLMMSQNYTLSQAINNVELPNPYRLLRKLFKRHEREILGSRSIFKLLFEGDESRNQSILVEVLDIVDDVIYVSDGIYCITAKADDIWVTKLIANKLLRPGIKIILDEFVRSSQYTSITATSPHLLANDEYISFKYNSIRKAKYNARVGRCPKIARNIYDIKIGGGNISLIDIVVLKGLPKTYSVIDKQGNNTSFSHEELAYKLENGQINLEDCEIVSYNQYIIIDYSLYASFKRFTNKEIPDINKFTNRLHNSIAYLSFKNMSDHINDELTRKHCRLKLSLVSHGSKPKFYQIDHLKHIDPADVDPIDFLKCRYHFSHTAQLSLYINTRSRLEMIELTKDNIFSLPEQYCDIPTSLYTTICGIPVLSLTHYTIQYHKSYLTDYHIEQMCQLCDIELGLFSSKLSILPEYTSDNYCIDILPGLGARQDCSILGLPLYVTELEENLALGFRDNKSLYIRIFIQTLAIDILCVKVTTYTSDSRYEWNKKQILKLKQKIDGQISIYRSQIHHNNRNRCNNMYEMSDRWILLENLKFARYDDTNRIFQFETYLDRLNITRGNNRHLEIEQQFLNLIDNNIQIARTNKKLNVYNTSNKHDILVKYTKIVLNNMLRVGQVCSADEHYMKPCMECLFGTPEQI